MEPIIHDIIEPVIVTEGLERCAASTRKFQGIPGIERENISYPDGVEADDGTIYVIYDRERQGAGDILMARFTERDILAGKTTDTISALKISVSRLGSI